MTVKAELDSRGREIYGQKRIYFDTDPELRRHTLIDPQLPSMEAADTARFITIPQVLPLAPHTEDGVSKSSEVQIIDPSSIKITREYAGEGESESTRGGTVYTDSDINNLNEVVLLPGFREGETVTARLVWEKDYPVISRLRRGLEKVQLAARRES